MGGKDYKKSRFNVATSSKRMIGSTIKPMLYYEAIENGFTPLSSFKSEAADIYLGSEKYSFKNYSDLYDNKKITMAYALATSDNIYAIKTHLYLGSEKLINFLKKFNIDEIEDVVSLALGSVHMSLLELTTIYNTFSTLGLFDTPTAVNKIISNNKVVYLKKKKEKELLSKATSYIITDLLTGTFDTKLSNTNVVTGARIANLLNCKVAAKSGLTDYDSYFIGYTPLYTIGIWSGYEDNSLLIDEVAKRYPKDIFPIILNTLMNKKNTWYEKPNAVYMQYVSPRQGYYKNLYFKKY